MGVRADGNFYVYLHKTPCGQTFYVGKGFGRRAWIDRRSKWWRNVVSKHGGFCVEIVERDLQEWAAYELEAGLIALHGRRDLGLGPLVNLTDGGEGGAGRVLTKTEREAISKRSIGKSPSAETREKQAVAKRGKSLSAEHRKKLSDVIRGENAPWYGKQRSASTKEKIRIAHTGTKQSPETLARRSETMKRLRQEETYVNAHRQAVLAWWQSRKSIQQGASSWP